MSSVPNEDRLGELLRRWDELHRQGREMSAGELCADCPEHADELRRRIGVVRNLEPILDVGPTHLASTPAHGSPDGFGYDRRLPNDLHATSVYRPERFHAQGGLGQVLAAHQEELDRTVALKRIRPDKLHDAARRRFLCEAAITARLQHPGIVPIYGLGQDDDGPFYTMPFIEGRTLQDAIEAFHGDESLRHDPGRRALSFRGLLQQFIAVCNTMAYAHDQGVIHRDLKPSNIMLGPYGETLVMDWGLGKQLGTDDAGEVEGGAPSPSPWPDALTATGVVLGTPYYMSPEQARGECVGPASDVFSLGLILYAILTGKSPYAEAVLQEGRLQEGVREATVVPPRQRDPGLPAALVAICLKALAGPPEARYSTARALADDVSRWLADEPVTAYRNPFAERARRWVKRNQTAATGAAIALLAGVLGLGAVAGLQARHNRRLEQANAAITKEKNKAEKARAQSEAVTAYLVEAFRSPDPSLDGRQIKVADVLDWASERIDRGFAGSQATRGALLDTLGTTYRGLGLYDQAVSLYTKAAAGRESALGRDHPDTLKSRSNLAAAQRDAGRLPEAIALQEATLKSYETKLGPNHRDTLTSRHNLAVAYISVGRWTEANAHLKATLKAREAVLGPHHTDTLTSRNAVAFVQLLTGRYSEAIALYEATLKVCEAVLGPDHPDTLTSRHRLGIAYWEIGRVPEAIALHQATLKLYESKLGSEHPNTLSSRTNLARAYKAAGRYAEAIALYEATLRLGEKRLRPDHPNNITTREELAEAYHAIGRVSEAIALFNSTLDLLEAKLGSDYPDAQWSRIGLADVYDSLGRWAEAERLYRDVLASRRTALDPESPTLARSLAALARNLLTQSRSSEAEPLVREALAIRAKATPDDWTRYEAMSLLGWVLLCRGRFGEAEPLIVPGYEGMKAREARIWVPDRRRLSEGAERVIRLYEAWGRPGQATEWKRKLGLADLPAEVFARP
jgi:serine/threonine protein kinase/tetratricopeptide (TPR) repeat protein